MAVAAEGERSQVLHIKVDSIIHPVAKQFVLEAIEEAERTGVDALVIELSTPGGLLTSTREIFTAMLGSEVPVVVYVGPSGAQAASAGFFILMAADVAAMAPGTNTGAAHPVMGDGKEIEGVMAEKVEQDALATIRSLANRNGRNPELAEAAVKESKSYTADEALEGGLIDLVADDLDTLLEEIHGREIQRNDDETLTLQTADATVRELEMSAFQRFLSTIAHPNIAYILMTLGGLGLYFELSNPGAVLPGVIGAICLVLAFFALSVLPVNYAGIALIILAMIFFIAEVKVTSFGLLTVAGVISLVIGSLMLFKSPDPAIRVSLDVIFSVVVFAVVVVGFLTFMVVRAHRQQVRTGSEGLINKRGVARTSLDPHGKVFVHGEIWDAVSDGTVESGDEVAVVAVDGLTLRVRSLAPATPERSDPAGAET
jgi:membrane-bound serine protease (ClpP class)